MEGMLRPTSTCRGIIPDLETIPEKLGSVLFSYDSKMHGSVEKFVSSLDH